MICLVTDRRRLASTAADPAGSSQCLVAQVRQAVDAGVDLVQVRERDLEARALVTLVGELLALASGTPTRVIVNDRMDVALACGAHGVHLRGDSIPIRRARQLAPPGFLIGRSVHRVEEALDSGDADYLIAGTVFPSASKAEATPLLGIAGLQAIVRAVDRPVLAIGGIGPPRLGEIAATGAAGFAAIGFFMAAPADAADDGCRVMNLRQAVQRARAQFDSPNRTP